MRDNFARTYLGSIFKRGRIFDIYLRRDGRYAIFHRMAPPWQRPLAVASSPAEIDDVIERRTALRRKPPLRG